jgi:2-polyprenyl-3-methyl-5-hydroxy-6-metoxy-1,4-benzoquinol methylase
MSTCMPTLQEQFGAIDIYLFDQLLRGNVSKGMTIFDAGCGTGRNIVYLLREGYEVFGADPDPQAIDAVRRLAPHLPADNFRVESVEAHSFPDLSADVVIINTVLHFARDDDHFHSMLHGCWRTLKPGGLFFCRLASTIGAERLVRHLHDRWYAMADGTERYLVDEAMLMQVTNDLGAELVDPIKTTVVQNLRSMTTWVLRKS